MSLPRTHFVVIDPATNFVHRAGFTDTTSYDYMMLSVPDAANYRVLDPVAGVAAKPGQLYDPETGTTYDRPELGLSFDKTTITTAEEAVMNDLPAAKIKVSWLDHLEGPGTAEQTHPGGDFEFGADLPAVYTVTITAWPAKPATFEITVTP